MMIPSSEPVPPPPPQTISKPPSAARGKPTPESSAAAANPPPPPPPLRCPRCDSANTKFCYYNNYSLSQPRHFCKSCRRYWTKGGSLRNIPIGGGCRKTKKPSSSSAAAALAGDLKLFHGISSPSSSSSSIPDHFPPLNLNPFTTTGSNLMGLNSFNFPFTTDGGGGGGAGGSAPTLSMASSIESLSAQNLELHWKLQQQRMSLLYGGETDSMINLSPTATDNNNFQRELHHEAGGPTSFVGVGPVVVEKPQPIYFQNLEAVTNNAKPNNVVVHPCGNDAGDEAAATEWFFDRGSYGGGGSGGNNAGNGKEEESNIINGRNATNSLNIDGGSCGAQGWADDDDQFHHFNGMV